MDFLSFLKRAKKNEPPLHTARGYIARKDSRGGLPADTRKLIDAFTGDDESISLYSAMLLQPIEVPVDMVGTPQFVSEDDVTQDGLNIFTDTYVNKNSGMITRTALLTGTAWRYPRYSEKCGVFVEDIPDDEVQDCPIDRETGNVKKIWLDSQTERQTLSSFWQASQVDRLRRTITPEIIKIQDNSGMHPPVINFMRTMPIPFSHDRLENRARGVPVYGRIYSTAKMGHQVLMQAAQVASKFKPKLVQTLASGAGFNAAQKWLNTQANARGFDGSIQLNPLTDDVYINIDYGTNGKDTTEFTFLPSDALTVFEKLLAIFDQHIIIGSGLPELFWSQLTKSNYASAEIAAELGVRYIKSIQSEFTDCWHHLASDWLRIHGYVNMKSYKKFEVTWSSFDLLGTAQKANVMSVYAGAVAQLMTSGALTKDLAVYFLKLFFADAPVKNTDTYIEEILAFTETRKGLSTAEPVEAAW